MIAKNFLDFSCSFHSSMFLHIKSPRNEVLSIVMMHDAKVGITTGVSASDRAKTAAALASPNFKPEDFRRPGHVFPLKYKNGGVLRRAGHTESSVDLVMLAELRPVSVLSAIIDQDDGSMASLTTLRKLSLEHNIPIVSITDLIRYERKRERLV
ncbi:monofunctional riboflavin biosynthesis protein RIBA 3, chloroplastic-like [Spinacia oleracea]|uniref:Monofunctional riboflavin biosynthesis protein RIBA 3, chloroplastic-like n=1 Tax=Spinacia oleracea TaxID=3562 RepID=A0A9R0JMJ3_SPIOL|nr:monofunctional riboflavin biosynthesis protein RIBA 3, chloroplastic-like [Spinacia oleracea]